MITLSKKQIIMLHSQLIAETGGTNGIRDEGLLDSALSSPFQSFADTEVYPSIQ
jgi:death-on-curing protein